MPYVNRRATFFLRLMVVALVLLIAAFTLLVTQRPALALEPIQCWQARALLAYAGSEAEAEKLARKRGYTQSQIAEVRRRCGL
jgi:hypothetical protein